MTKGYKNIWIGDKCVLEHRYIMELHLGRKLSQDEVVHHIDDDGFNNDLSNLKLMPLQEHTQMHQLGKEKWETNPHPKGFLDKKHTESTKQMMSKSQKIVASQRTRDKEGRFIKLD